MEDEQQRLVVRERHTVGLRGMAPDRRDEPFLVRCAGVEPALARDHPSHTHRDEARNPRLAPGKFAPRPWLSQCGAIDSGAVFDFLRRRYDLLSTLSYRTQSWSMSMPFAGLYW